MFLVLVECKHHRRKVERQDVQVLHSKLQSVGAQKCMLFSTAGFQSGAIEYAGAHGIALIQVVDGSSSWVTGRADAPTPPPPWVRIPKHIGCWHHGSSMCIISEDHVEYTRQALGLTGSEP